MAYTVIRPRHGIKSIWDKFKSRVYREGEMLVESPESGVGTGLVNIKFGDGTTNYENLPYGVLAPIDEIAEGAKNPVTSAAVIKKIRESGSLTDAKTLEGHGAEYFATAEGLNGVQSTKIKTISSPGWYRIAKKKADYGYTCLIKLGNVYNAGGSSEQLLLLSKSHSNEGFSLLSSKTSNYQIFTKIRVVRENGVDYIEVYYPTTYSNPCSFTVMDFSYGKNIPWQTIDVMATQETVEGVTVTTTYDIPANASLVTDLDLDLRTLPQTMPSGTDLNDCIETGWYYFSGYASNYPNTPNADANQGIMQVTYVNKRVTQLYFSANQGLAYVRTNSSSAWTTWKTLATTADLAKYLPLTGGDISGDIIGAKTGNTAMRFRAGNASRKIDLVAGTSASGLYVPNLGVWAVEVSDDGTAKVNGTASGNLKLNGGGEVTNIDNTVINIRNTNGATAYVGYRGKDGQLGYMGFQTANNPVVYSATMGTQKLLHTGNSAKVHIGTSAPSDTNALWIDTST